MTLVIQVANNNVKDLLENYGEIVYESRILDLIYLNLNVGVSKDIIKTLPGVLSIEEENEGNLMTI